MNATLETKVVTSSAEVMSGAPVFAGTRVPAQSLLDYLAGGHTIEEFLDDFPTVKRTQAVEFLSELSHSFHLALEKWKFSSTNAYRRNFKHELTDHFTQTVPEAGWAATKNGELLRLAENLKQFDLAIVVLVAPTNDINDQRPLMPSVIAVLDIITPGEIVYIK